MYIRCRKKIFLSDQMFDHNPESKEDLHLAYIEWKKTSLPPPEYKRAAIVFQPTAQASPASTKTNWRCVGSLGVEVKFFFAECVPNGCLLWFPGYG